MRQKKYEITDKFEIEAILSASRVGRLATNGADGYPYVTPLNYVYTEGRIYMHCARAGERIDNLKRDNKICFEVDEAVAYIDTGFSEDESICNVTQLYRSVIIRGKAELVDNVDEKVQALNNLMASHERTPDFDKITPNMRPVKMCDVIRVTIESMTGKQNVGKHRSESYGEAVVKYKPALAGHF